MSELHTTADATQTSAAATRPPASTASPHQSHAVQGTNATERGWDGWPTPPTPSSLIPQLGRLPVSSTVHFQTVAMTKMYDDISPAKLRQLRASLLARAKSDGDSCPADDEARYLAEQIEDYIHSQTFRDVVQGTISAQEFTNTINSLFVEAGFEPLQVRERADLQGITRGSEEHYRKVRVSNIGPEAFVFCGDLLGRLYDFRTTGEEYRQTAPDAILAALQQAKIVDSAGYCVCSSEQGVLIRLLYDFSEVTRHMVNLEDTIENVHHGSAPNYSICNSVVQGLIDARILDTELTLVDVDEDKVDACLRQIESELMPNEEKDLVMRCLVNITSPIKELCRALRNVATILDENLRAREQAEAVVRSALNPEDYEMEMCRIQENMYNWMRQTVFAKRTEAIDALFLDRVWSFEDLLNRLDTAGITPESFDNSVTAPAPSNTTRSEQDDPATRTPSPDLQAVLSRFLFGVEFDDGRLNPIKAEPDTMDTPAEGVILYHEQGWYARGLALGNLLHSVALAPGEVTQVAMTHWNHRTRSTDSEQTSQDDSTTAADRQNRAVQEIQDAALREHTSGGSAANSAADSSSFGRSSTEIDGSVGWLSASASISGTSQSSGSSHNVSHVASYTGGSKDVAMQANQAVVAATQRHAEAARTRRATVVREVSQSEDENLTTRVLANYNHMHAMTVMYFEVIEVFDLKTRIVDAERVIFLPFVVSEVKDLIPKFRAVLIDAANAAGQPALAEAIRHYQPDDKELNDLRDRISKIDGKTDNGQPPNGELPTATAELKAIQDEIADLPMRFDPQREALRAKISALSDGRANALNQLRAEMPSFLEPYVEQALRVQWQPLDEEMQRISAQIEALSTIEQQVRAQLQATHTRLGNRVDSLRRESKRLNEAARLLDNLSNGSQRGPFHDNKLYFNQAVWLSLSPGEVLSLARRRYMVNGEVLCERIDPAPVAISGNYVAYRWRCESAQTTQDFKQQYVEPFIGDPDQELKTVSSTIAVPTGGIFGEAVLGQGVAAEKIDLSRFWNWKDSMIPILPTSINPLSAAKPTMESLSAEPGKLDESSAKLGQLQDMPAPSGFGALAQTMQAQVLRDMSGQAMLQTLAEATTKAASSSEQNAAKIASDNLKAGLDFVKDMSSKAISAMAAPETGGASTAVGDLLKSKDGGGASLLGGVMNAKDGSMAKLAGGKGDLANPAEDGAVKQVTDAVEGKGDNKEAETSDEDLEEKPKRTS